ncbi:hypothetical protein GCM10007275_09020 [Jeotgalicoccus coquinae]|uniref:Bifunctional UDP-sugar hydrolase/5'-nucleotidase periplasmic n=1 Tax=Jeotgalicoccus coquinae TaxID=709509 RepID=A0A6V7RLE0_9STAP|nr:hypothetical protein [Jeotgalicoccus coquinae]MBB6422430.1 hypothetical protein [Jeotgalicoccus coquinae]GGE15910.1 hypothetical protein GCM10007275_09020 [Jeotgalicoccus coquinae]CAD2078649.1 bifunctional UDP-sugar hydrolase/5'-nucleotidase periplasmic precursor [Jeotgalicoccus coquinae]
MVSEFFNVKLYITQHMNERLGRKEGVTFGKISSAVNSMNMKEYERPIFCDLGGAVGDSVNVRGPQNPHIMSMNHLRYKFATLNVSDLKNIAGTSKAMRTSYFPWISTNIVQKFTNEPFYGQPYRIFNMNKMKLAVVGGYGGPAEEKTEQISAVNLQASFKKWLRYLHSKENPDYVIVFVSDFTNDDEEIEKLKISLEGVGIVIIGSDYEKNYDEQTSPFSTTRVHGEKVPLYHHVHNGRIMELDIRFKTRVNTFEYLGHSMAVRDKEFSKVAEDIEYLDLVYRYL